MGGNNEINMSCGGGIMSIIIYHLIVKKQILILPPCYPSGFGLTSEDRDSTVQMSPRVTFRGHRERNHDTVTFNSSPDQHKALHTGPQLGNKPDVIR